MYRAFKRMGRLNWCAWRIRTKAQAQALMERYGQLVAYHADYKRMLKTEALDVVFISSPHSLHYEQARLALQQGLHVLVEKPLTISSKDTKALIALSNKQKRFLQVSYQRNYYPQHVYARELVQKGAIGELRGGVSYVTQNWGACAVGGWTRSWRHVYGYGQPFSRVDVVGYRVGAG
jgi:predicted dehydrogenase